MKMIARKREDAEMLMKIMALVLVAWSVAGASLADEATLEKPLPFGRHEEVGARVVPGEPGTLRVTFVPDRADAVVRLKPAEGTWNLDEAAAVLVDVRNRGGKPATLFGRIDGRKWCDSVVVVPPGATETLWLLMKRDTPPRGFAYRFPYMLGRPGGDLPADDIEIGNLRVKPWNAPLGKATGPLDDSIFPFVDQYGQYMHREWPGKIHGDADLITARQAEDADLKDHPGPADWDAYGGWAKGPVGGTAWMTSSRRSITVTGIGIAIGPMSASGAGA
jgi:hypothetical protein